MNIEIWSEFYKDGFFGYSETIDFTLGSLAHIIPILITIFIIFVIYKNKDRLKNNIKLDSNIIYILIFIMLFAEMSYWWRLLYTGPGNSEAHSMLSKLPIQVCQWTLLITVFALITKSNNLLGTAFFLTTLPSLLAIIVPTVIEKTGPSYFRYYQYWLEHLTPIISVYYMIFVHSYKIKFKHIIYTGFVLSVLFFIGSKANVLIPSGIKHLYLYMDYLRKIPFLTNVNDFVLYLFCLGIIFPSFCIVYIIYKKLESK